jgi:putative methyltransferase (TIGR04325 family)
MTTPLLAFLRRLPPVRAVRRHRFERVFKFSKNTHLFDGEYASFADAAAAAPATKPAGYNSQSGAAMYRDRLDRDFPEDRPLAAALDALQPQSVLDFGGHVGITWYAMQRVLGDRMASVTWTVVELPVIVAEGRALAKARGAPVLFNDSLDEQEADVFLASGVLQYVEDDLPTLLQRLRRLPRAVVLHKTPLTDGKPFITLNAIGTAFCPYGVRGRAHTIEEMARLGYRLDQSWRAEQFACVPWDRLDLAVYGYTGAVFLRSTP